MSGQLPEGWKDKLPKFSPEVRMCLSLCPAW